MITETESERGARRGLRTLEKESRQWRITPDSASQAPSSHPQTYPHSSPTCSSRAESHYSAPGTDEAHHDAHLPNRTAAAAIPDAHSGPRCSGTCRRARLCLDSSRTTSGGLSPIGTGSCEVQQRSVMIEERIERRGDVPLLPQAGLAEL